MTCPQLIHLFPIIFFAMLGACIGSFLNVVVWRLPRVELPEKGNVFTDFFAYMRALSDPPSHCPRCNTRLKWYDNLPVLGWIKLRGRCRFCREPISTRYPIIEAITGLLFAGYYTAYYVFQVRACCPQPRLVGYEPDLLGNLQPVFETVRWVLADSWPIYLLYMALISALLASSLIDAELFVIPQQIPWVIAFVGVMVHTIVDRPSLVGAVSTTGVYGHIWLPMGLGGAVGLIITWILMAIKMIPPAFPQGEPLLEVDLASIREEKARLAAAGETWKQGPLPPVYSKGQIRREMGKEMLFLTPSLLGAGLAVLLGQHWSLGQRWVSHGLHLDWLTGFAGAMLGAMVGAFVVWIVRIIGTLVLGRVAMGLGDMHLMFGVGAVIGAMGATIAFFLAPFFALLLVLYILIAKKGRELPLGPFLSMATAAVMLIYCPIANHLSLGLEGAILFLGQLMQHTS